MFSYHPSSCIKCANATKCEARNVCAGLDIVDSPVRPIISKYDSKPELFGKSAPWEMISQCMASKTFALIAIDAFRPVSISKELVAMDGSMIKSVATPLEHLVLLLKMSALNVDNVLTDAQLEPLLKNQKLNRSLKPSKTQRKK